MNVTDRVQVAWGASEPVQLLAEIAKLGLTVTPEITRLACPAFSSVVVSGGLATPMAELPKSKPD